MTMANKSKNDAGVRGDSYGRVVKLHFACRAELPIGSTLRVTSSQLWAPGTLTPSDPTDAKTVSQQATETGLPDNSNVNVNVDGDDGALAGMSHSIIQSYASSVEMVTSPDQWPLWTTNKPVVVSLRHHHGRFEQHRYRYLVVTPGARPYDHDNVNVRINNVNVNENQNDNHEDDNNDNGNEFQKVNSKSGVTCTSNDADFATEVMAWEDPFQERQSSEKDLAMHTSVSGASFLSVKRDTLSKTIANLPYRTVHIDTHTVQVRQVLATSNDNEDGDNDGNGDGREANIDGAFDQEFTPDSVRIDHWNNSNDYSFYPFTVRDQMNTQNKLRKQKLLSAYASYNTAISDDCENTDIDNDSTASINPKDAAFLEVQQQLQQLELQQSQVQQQQSHQQPVTVTNACSPRMNTKVSFSNLVEISTDTGRVPDDADADDENADADADEGFASNISSVTMTPNIGTSSHASLKSAFSRRQRQRIYFVCFHLPIILTHDDDTNEWKAIWAESLLAATEGSTIVRDYDAMWIGTVKCSSHPITTQKDKDAVTKILAEMHCTPLFLDENLQDMHYKGMCKQVLWPAFHNVDLLDLSASGMASGAAKANSKLSEIDSACDWDQSSLLAWWKAYQDVNAAFGDVLLELLKPGDIMWVHDYHLSLLPKIVDDRERAEIGRSVTKKVFLLHIPFPTSQIFHELECGEEILKAMLHADVVGFHAFDHARHFLNATKRLLGLNHESLIGGLIGIKIGRKTVLVTMHNVSVEPFQLEAALAMPSIQEHTARLKHNHSSRLIISGIDITQRLSGISLKLLAFEQLLRDYPVWQKQVVLIQKCLIPGSRHDDEANTLREVRQLVKRIKEKFGPHVIDYEETYGSSLPIDKRLSLWKVTDVFMATPIREGLNLWPLEYVYCRKKPSAPGVVICSEFSVVSNVLNGALRVNPFDIKMSVTCLDKALTMAEAEKDVRRARDEAFVTSCTSSRWTKSVLNDLYDATAAAAVDGDDNESDDTSIMGTKFDKQNLITSTSQFLAHEKEIAFGRLDIKAVVGAYKRTKNRVLLLDLNGTIIIKEPPGKYLKREILGSSGFDVNPEVNKALTMLCADPLNTVFVVSGDSQENVIKAVGDIPGVGIAASNGACFAPALKPGETERDWKHFDLGVDWGAVKRIALPILAKFTARSNGSFVKLTHSSIGWSYYSCDPEWGSLQASHLVLELEHQLRSFDVRFVMIKGIVEVVPRRLNKGLIAKNVLRDVEERSGTNSVDFILCMGDDVQDEKMFTSVFSFISEQDSPSTADPGPPIVDVRGCKISGNMSFNDGSEDSDAQGKTSKQSTPLYAFTSVVGKKPSHAFTYVDDARDVSTMLLRLAGLHDSTLSNEAIAGIEHPGYDD